MLMTVVKLVKVRQVIGRMARVPVGKSVHFSAPPGITTGPVFMAHGQAVEVGTDLHVKAVHATPSLPAQVRKVPDDLLVAASWLAVTGQRGG